ncbi:hypothetical protein, partial [Nocardia cyriacigeorgica]|uniref:hypothetical protein n=1 Tax=Nocardia cyriacigeorgica TaxID=135487 RepID=UPI002456D3F4
MLKPIYEEVELGRAEIRAIFRSSKVGNIAAPTGPAWAAVAASSTSAPVTRSTAANGRRLLVRTALWRPLSESRSPLIATTASPSVFPARTH